MPLPIPTAPVSSDEPSVLVVILNWNAPDETIAAVTSVFGMDYPNFKVVVVENGSTDNSASVLRAALREEVQLVISEENLGYTGGCNLGIDLAVRSDMDYVWLLNSDALTESGTLSSLVRTAESDQSIGLVSPVIARVDEPSKLVHVAARLNPAGPTFAETRLETVARDWIREVPEQVMLLGTALLVRVAMVRKIGGLDPDLFAYWEDADLSARAVKAGFHNVVDFDSTIYHTEKSAADAPHEIRPHYWYYMARNEFRFWRKHANLSAQPRLFWWSYKKQLRFLKMVEGNEAAGDAILAGLWHGYTRETGPYRPDRRMPGLVAALVRAHSKRL